MTGAEPESDSRARALELYADWLARRVGREDVDALCSLHPELEPDLRAVHAEWSRVASIHDALTAGRTVIGRLQLAADSAHEGPDLEGQASAKEHPSAEVMDRLQAEGPKRSRYELRGEVGRGGMGAVLKVWDPDLRRTLAMKVILGGLQDTATGKTQLEEGPLARFLEEAQVTGQLDHPGIVPVHELGLDPEGRVYFTMRLVKGRDLEKIFNLVHRGEEGWNLTRTVRAILKATEAMAYAHKKGVIHRDLKPANIMVGPFGEVYVMDWGLARVMGRKDLRDVRLRRVDDSPSTSVQTDREETRQRTADSPLMTMDGQVMGTPAYMSPEQARGELQMLDERSDVYSLGAMLYHLLAGHAPYAPPGKKRTPIQTCLLVQREAPEPLGEQAPHAPAELVAIAEKAMRRRRRDRYATMREMAEDLNNYLDGHVVSAYEAGALAELRKWVRRNRSTAVASVAAIVVLLGGLGSTAYVQARANRKLEAKNVEVQVERDAGERVIEFLVNLFQSPDPRFSRGEEVTAKELLDQGARTIESFRGDDALVWTRLMDGMGQAYHSLGLYEDAEPLTLDSYRHRLDLLGPEHEDTLQSLNELALVYRSQGRYADAEAHYLQALETERAVFGDSDPRTLSTMAGLAHLRYFQGRYEEAVELHQQALDGRRAVLGANDLDTLRSMKDLALVYRKQARYDEALALLTEAREGYRSEHGEDHPDALKCLNDLAGVYLFQGKFDLAEDLYQHVVAERTRVLGAEHPDTLVSLNDFGNLYYRQGDVASAEPLWTKALEGYRRKEAEDHPNALVILINLASIYAQDRSEEAEALFDEALKRNLRVRGPDHPYTMAALNGLAKVYVSQGRYGDAEPLYLQAADGLKKSFGANHPNRLIILDNLVDLYAAQDNAARAEELALEVLELTPTVDPSYEPRRTRFEAIVAGKL